MIDLELPEATTSRPRGTAGSWWARGLVSLLAVVSVVRIAAAQEAPPVPSPAPPAAPTPAAGAEPSALPASNDELREELIRLRSELKGALQLQQQVQQLQAEVNVLRARPPAMAPAAAAPALAPSRVVADLMDGDASPAVPMMNLVPPRPVPPRAPSSPTEGTFGGRSFPGNDSLFDFQPLVFRYRYQSTAEGPIAGGTYLQISDPDEEYVLKFQNQVTIDSVNYDRQGMLTTEQGFNIPFGRTGIWGNVSKNYFYQVCFQYSLGDINLLDMFAGFQWDKYRIRIGKGLSPVLYEYYAFDPAFEPVQTNSMSFQLANKRPIGATFIANEKYYQFWAGIDNNLVSGYYDLGRNAQFVTALTLTPFKDADGSIFQHLGGGVGASAGWEKYGLFNAVSNTPNLMEQTTNNAWVTSTGVPFAVYNTNVSSVGERTRIAPHLFWYGRFSFVGEYILHSRELTDGVVTGRSTQRAWQTTASYYLTGERDYGGNGIQGFSSVEPLRPFLPSRGQWGPGAWQVAAQYSAFDAGRGDFDRGFINPTRYTNRAEQVMAGLNWWPVKNTRLSAQVLWNGFNNPIPVSQNGAPVDSFFAFWFRYAMFF